MRKEDFKVVEEDGRFLVVEIKTGKVVTNSPTKKMANEIHNNIRRWI